MAVRLSRTVRFTVSNAEGDRGTASRTNGFGGTPAMRGLGAYYELRVVCTGPPDPQTGYLVNIKAIDLAVRETAIPRIEQIFRQAPGTDPGTVLPEIAAAIAERLEPRTTGVRWRLTPTYSVEIEMNDPTRVLMRQRFDFAASHRLHVAELTDDENRRLFGKCNNPTGHGHNYVVEPAVAVDPASPNPLTLPELEALTDELIIDRFDHTNLNADTDEFGESGVNPSVEHIARVCYERLASAIADRGAELRSVTVWETDRTSCTYPAE
ncbi:MAG: 6-carboxytetrahydropterin synthase [Planctomycetota bacterium]